MGEPPRRWMSLTGWVKQLAIRRGRGDFCDTATQASLAPQRTKTAGWLASRPVIYISIILCTVLAAYAYKLRFDGIFKCETRGYTSDRYLAYCNAPDYADYEHGAFLLKLEPQALAFAKRADVLFLGDSHIQYGFSTAATSEWFTSAPARFYLLGFVWGGNMALAEPLLREIKPSAKVYVLPLNIFSRTESAIAKEVLHDSAAEPKYRTKRVWQPVHKEVCSRFPKACGGTVSVFRSRETGFYYHDLSRVPDGWRQKIPVDYYHEIEQARVAKYTSLGEKLLAELPVGRDCIILTRVPTVRAKAPLSADSVETALAVASALGITLVAPDLDGLMTFDGIHLEPSSAERWSKAFFEAAGPQIRKCLSQPSASSDAPGSAMLASRDSSVAVDTPAAKRR